MAANSIGSLRVNLSANTSEFVSGMANSERAIARVANTATKSRAAIAGVGSALRVPGLGRAAAFGGVGSAAAAALGFGALGGGVGGLAATGVFMAIDGFVQAMRNATEEQVRIAQRAKAASALVESMSAPAGPARNLIEQIQAMRAEAEPKVATLQASIADNERRMEEARRRMRQIDAQRPTGELSPNMERIFYERQVNEALIVSGLINQNEQLQGTIQQIQTELNANIQKLRDQEAAPILEELQKQTAAMQRQSEAMATSIGGVEAQIRILQARRDR